MGFSPPFLRPSHRAYARAAAHACVLLLSRSHKQTNLLKKKKRPTLVFTSSRKPSLRPTPPGQCRCLRPKENCLVSPYPPVIAVLRGKITPVPTLRPGISSPEFAWISAGVCPQGSSLLSALTAALCPGGPRDSSLETPPPLHPKGFAMQLLWIAEFTGVTETAEAGSRAQNTLLFKGRATPASSSVIPDPRESLTSWDGGGTCPLRVFWKRLPLRAPPPSVLVETSLWLAPWRPLEGPHLSQIHWPLYKAAAICYFKEPLFWAELCPHPQVLILRS